MRKQVIHIFFISICITSFGQTYGQSNVEKGYPFITNYSYLDYNADPLNWWAEEDDRGLMYFANSQGILEYDGADWKLIGRGQNGGSRCLTKGDDGIIYAGMEGDLGYLSVNAFGETIFVSLKNKLPEKYRVFETVWTSRKSDEGIWFLSDNLLFLWNYEEFKVWESEEGFHVGAVVNGKYYIRIWDKGLHVMEGEELVLVPEGELFADERIYVMLPHDNQMLIGTRTMGFYLYDGQTFSPFETEVDELIVNNLYLTGEKLKNGNYVLNTLSNGLVIMGSDGKLIRKIDVNTGLQDNNTYFVFVDSKETLWIAMANGISKIDLSSPFSFLSVESGLSNKDVYDIIRHNDILYVGGQSGVYFLDPDNSRFQPIIGSNGQAYRFIKKGGDLLIGDSDLGVIQIDGDKLTPIRLSVNYDYRASTLYPSNVDTTLVYVTINSGISALRLYPDKTGSQRWVEESVTRDFISVTFEETPDGKIWLDGDHPGQVRRLTPRYHDGKLSLPESEVVVYDTLHGLINENISFFKFDDQVYFCNYSLTQFFIFDEEKQKFVEEKSLPFIDFLGAKTPTAYPLKDEKGRIWGDYGSGVFTATKDENGQYNFVSTIFKEFQKFRINSIFPEYDNEGNCVVWLATSESVLRFEGDLVENFVEDYSAFIRQITLNEDSLIYLGNGILPEKSRFDHTSNTLKFNFTTPYYKSEKDISFQTYLEGFDKGWSLWRNQNEREYINLPPGNYTFHVKAKNVFDQLSKEDSFTFNIAKPWYYTWWAYMTYLFISGLIVYFFVKWRLKKLKNHSIQLEKEVTLRTKEIQQRVEELGVINSVQEALVAQMDLNGIYNMVGEQIKDVFDAQAVVINMFDHENNLSHYAYAYEKGEVFNVEPKEIDPLRQKIIDSGKHILINNNFVATMEAMGAHVTAAGSAPKSALWVPLITGDKVTGSVSLQNVDHENAFSENDVKLVSTLTNSMAVGLENARLFEESNKLLEEIQQQAKELELINSVQRGLVEQIETEGIFNLVGDKIRDRFNAQAVVINTFDTDNELAYYPYIFEKGEKYNIKKGVKLNNIFKELISSKEPILVNKEYSRWREDMGLSATIVGELPKSALWVPIIMAEKVIGSVSLQNVDDEDAFNYEDLELLRTLSNTMSVALQNTRLFEETRQRANEMSTVNSVSQALTSNLDLSTLMKMIGDKLQELFQADIVYIAMLNRNTNMINFPYQYGDNLQPLKMGEGLTSNIIKNKKSSLINTDVAKKHEELGIERIGIAAASYLGVPILSGEDVLGVLSVQSTQEMNRFSDSDMHLLETIASNVGIAIHNAQLFEEAEQSRADAEAANEAKSAFLSTVSHELRTPLTSVLGFAKIIKKRLEEKIFPKLIKDDDPKTQKTVRQISENLNVVVSEGQRLTKLINEVLDLAKIEAGKTEWHMEELQIINVIERAISATNSLFEQKPLILKKELSPDIPVIIGDEDKLIQVIVNLLSNAVKFTDEGIITCKAIFINDEIQVSVQDSGIGISKNDLSTVFEKFKQVGDTLTDKPKGTGLGLPISKEIIEYHGGRLWLESTLNKGSTFYFALPLKPSQVQLPKTYKLDDLIEQIEDKFSAVSAYDPIEGKQILIADDEKHIRELLSQELNNAGYEVMVAENGKQALDIIRKNRIDLVILDVMMPEMNGFDAAAVLKNDPATRNIPIIILSIVEDKKRGYGIGIDQYLTKPIDMDKLLRSISMLLDQGTSRRKIMVVDEDISTVKTLMKVLQEKGYHTVEANGKELMEKAIVNKPDIIILKSNLSQNNEDVKSLRLEKGLENVLFLVYE